MHAVSYANEQTDATLPTAGAGAINAEDRMRFDQLTAVALAVSALMLWFLGRFDEPALLTCVSQVDVLGLAATLGASAGRLLLQ